MAERPQNVSGQWLWRKEMREEEERVWGRDAFGFPTDPAPGEGSQGSLDLYKNRDRRKENQPITCGKQIPKGINSFQQN